MIKFLQLGAIAICGTLAFAQTDPAQPTTRTQSSDKTTVSSDKTTINKETTSEGKMKSSRKAATATSGTSGESMVSAADRDFLNKAAEGGMAEVQLAQLAQKQASSDQVKSFAQKLEQDHSNANKQLMDIAQKRGVNVPSTLNPADQALIDKLSKASGAEFDKEYMKAMVKDHKKDIKEFEKHANMSTDTEVKTFASNTLPTLKEHLSSAESLNKDLSGSGSRSRTKDQTTKEHTSKTKMSDDGTTTTKSKTDSSTTTTPPPQH